MNEFLEFTAWYLSGVLLCNYVIRLCPMAIEGKFLWAKWDDWEEFTSIAKWFVFSWLAVMFILIIAFTILIIEQFTPWVKSKLKTNKKFPKTPPKWL